MKFQFDKVKINFKPLLSSDIYPLIIDYDFENKIPRGVSILMDIIFNNFIYETVNNFKKIIEPFFIRKNSFFLTEGFFLADFKNLTPEHKLFDFIKSSESDTIFIENSRHFNMDLFNDIGKKIVLVEFV